MSNEVTLEHIMDKLTSHDDMIQKTYELLKGNGKPGLVQEFALCRQKHELEASGKNTLWSRFGQPAVGMIYGGLALLIIWGSTQYLASKMDVRTAVRQAITEELQRGTP